MFAFCRLLSLIVEDGFRNPALCSVKITNQLLPASILGKTIDWTRINNKLGVLSNESICNFYDIVFDCVNYYCK